MVSISVGLLFITIITVHQWVLWLQCGDDDDGQHMMFRYLCHRKDYHAQQADPNGPQSVCIL